MSYRASVFWTVVNSLALLTFRPAESQAEYQHTIAMDVEQVATESGVVYRVNPFHQILGATNPAFPQSHSIAPDGTLFNQGTSAERETFAEIASLVFGDWVFAARIDQVDYSFQVRIAPFSLDDVFADVPTITSPVPGSSIGTEFTIRWLYEGGYDPGGVASGPVFSPNLERVGLPSSSANSQTYKSRFIGPGPGSFSIRVGDSTALPDPVLLGSPPTGHTFNLWAKFVTYSKTANYTVVPEPTAALLFILGSVSCASICRRRHVTCRAAVD